MKRLFVNFMTFAVMATALTLTACSSDSDGDGDGNGDGGNNGGTGSSIVVGENILSGTLTGEQTLEAKEYILNGTVVIENGGRLNIPAGTTIKAREGFSSYLLVAKGGNFMLTVQLINRLFSQPIQQPLHPAIGEESLSMVKLRFPVRTPIRVIQV